MALFTLTELKTHLGLSGTSEDAQLQPIVDGVDAAVKRWLKRNIEAVADAVEYHSGACRQRLYLRSRPATDVSSVKIDSRGYFGQGSGAFAADTEIDRGDDWALEDQTEHERNQSCLIYLNGVWPEGTGNIKVVYDHGYTTVPKDIKLGCLMIATQIRSDREDGGPMQSEDLGDYSYQIMTGGSSKGTELRQAMSLLRPYREIVL